MIGPEEPAQGAGLIHVDDDRPGIRRRRSGRGFSYRDAQGRLIRDRRVPDRIRALAIAPAYRDVWICADPRGHLQATGRNARGRKQYRYHRCFRAFRDNAKFQHMLDFAARLPRIRARVDADIGLRGLPAEKVLATMVPLLEAMMIRVGNDSYARKNHSHGLTTLRDRRAATIIRKVQNLPGQQLFQYLDADGGRCRVTSSRINDCLRGISGGVATASECRIRPGTVLAAMTRVAHEALDSEAAAQYNMRDAIATVAARLGNSPAICRKCHVHPAIIDACLADELKIVLREEIDETPGDTDLRHEERQVPRLLKKRLKP